MSEELARAAGAVGGLGLAAVIVVPWPGMRLAGLGWWAAACAMLALWLAPPGHAGVYAAAAGAGVGAATVLAVLFLRWPWLLPTALLASVPASIGVSVGGATGELLVPLYVVAAAAALALAWKIFWEEGCRELGPLAWPLALLVAWTGVALAWSDDPRRGATVLVLSVLPFGLLAAAVARLRWRPAWVALLFAELAAMGVAFAAIGLWEYLTRDVRLRPSGEVGDLVVSTGWYAPVDAVFRDPAHYANFLTVAIAASVAVVLLGRGRAGWAAAAAAVGFAGLVPAFSQPAIVAVAAAAAVALAVAWRRLAVVAVALAAAAAAAVALGVPDARHRILGDDGASHAVDVRRQLASSGIEVARDHPLAGVGTGGYRRDGASLEAAPVTVAAETGLPGLVLLASLVLAALALPFLRRSPLDTAVGRARAAVALALLAIVVHSLLADALLEDPLFWALLGLGAVAYRQAERA